MKTSKNTETKNDGTRILFINILMAIAALALGGIMLMVAMGYRVNTDWGLERSGLVQIYSTPTGATVTIDGKKLSTKTNISRTLDDGKHHVVITRPGYDSWRKDVNIRPGMVSRLTARLFPIDFTSEEVDKFEMTGRLSLSTGEQYGLLFNNTTKWALLDFRGNDYKQTAIDVAEMFEVKAPVATVGAEAETDLIVAGKIEVAGWSRNSERVIIKRTLDGKIEWFVLNVSNLKESVNVSKLFLMDFENMIGSNNSGSQMFALENGHIRMIDLSRKTISAVLVDKVEEVSVFESGLAYIATADEEGVREIGVYLDGEAGATKISEIDAEGDVRIMTGEYLGDKLLVYSVGAQIRAFSGNWPHFGSDNSMMNIISEELPFTPGSKLAFSDENRFLKIENGADKQVLVFDFDEFEAIERYSLERIGNLSWLDGYLLFSKNDSELAVMDYDGENYRKLIESGDDEQLRISHYFLSENENWFYFVETETRETSDIQVLKRVRVK
jgi:hypothetical protein